MNLDDRSSEYGNFTVWIAAMSVAPGVLLVALFPFALPFVILLTVTGVLLLLPAIPLAILGGLFLAGRALVRGMRGGSPGPEKKVPGRSAEPGLRRRAEADGVPRDAAA